MKNKGITLIALVITIIIMIILATISINMLSGDNGLIAGAILSRTLQREATAEEEIKLQISEVQLEKHGNATLSDILECFNKIGNNIEVKEVNINSEKEIQEIVVIVEGYEEFTFTIGNDLEITKICGINKERWNGETISNNEQNQEKINIIASPSSKTDIAVESLNIDLTITYTKNITSSEGYYTWKQGIVTDISNEEWNNLTLNPSDEKERIAEILGIENTNGNYYLYVKAIINGKQTIKSFGPYNFNGMPTQDNLIARITEKNETETQGTMEIGSNKAYSGWSVTYKVNNGQEVTLTPGTTTTITVVQNDVVTVKYSKSGQTDVIKTVTISELKVAYTLKYDANTGTNAPSDLIQYDNNIFTITTDEPIKTGYTFISWNTESDGRGTTYNKGANITINNTNREVTLYAQYTENIAIETGLITEETEEETSEKILTEGTSVSLKGKGMTNFKVTIGNITAYEETLNSSQEYDKAITIDEFNLTEISKLTFNEVYTIKLEATLLDGTKNTVEDTIKNNTIGSLSSLETFATLVNNGEKFEDETIYQIADIDMSTEYGQGKASWVPIGSSNTKYFNGKYNGNNKSILNIYISSNTRAALFSITGYKAVIEKITLTGQIYSSGLNTTAGIVAKNEGIIRQCVNRSNITNNNTSSGVGGIAGNTINNIIDCENYGIITGNGGNVGGIVGYISPETKTTNSTRNYKLEIEGCTNNGKVISSSSYVGGILGTTNSQTNILIIACKNNYIEGNLIQGESYIGGIIGNIDTNITVENCENEGIVTATSSFAGGIIGYMSNGTLQGCKNSGSITSNGNPNTHATTQGTGGICGRIGGGTIQTSSNTGNVSATTGYDVGGIAGFGVSGSINECFNQDCNLYTKENCVGGIIGRNDGVIINNCYNYLSTSTYYIKSDANNVGGIVGVSTGGAINNSYSIGNNIIGNNNKGAVIGNLQSATSIGNNYYNSTLDSIGKNNTNTTTGIESKSLTEFTNDVSKTTSSVTYLLNGNSDSGVWKQSSSVNGGFPYLRNNLP